MTDKETALQPLLISGRVEMRTGNGHLPKLVLTAARSTAEIYLHGAHVTHFQKQNERPLLFMSAQSLFASDKPIRGGVPLIFPWFGPRDGAAAHGFVRTAAWSLVESSVTDNETSVTLELAQAADSAEWPAHRLRYRVIAGETLRLELETANTSLTRELKYEECLHTYFAIGDIHATRITGLQGVRYLDKVDHFTEKTETSSEIAITGETDRVYLNTTSSVTITDPAWRRQIVVEKSDSNSTVVWNPWIAKAKAMADFGDDEYPQMLCVESGNVDRNRLTLAPGANATLAVELRSEAF